MVWAIVLLIFGIALAILEVMVPSGGMISILAGAALIGSVVLAFMENTTTGWVFLVVIVVGLPVVVVVGLRVFPQTPFGKRMVLKPVEETAEDKGQAGVSDENFGELLGKTGRTVTALRPSGIAEIEGQRYSVVSEGEMIEANCEIVVIEIEGNNIVVDQKTA